jgi:hypothetical protein
MALTVRLDPETQHCLDELEADTGQDKSALVRELIRQRWQQLQSAPSITERIGGHPSHFLNTLPEGGAERSLRRRLLRKRLARTRQP